MMKQLTAALLAALMLMTGCTGTDEPEETLVPSPTATATATAAPKPAVPANGGQITLAMRVPKTFNPLINADITVDAVLKLVYEPLAVLDETMKPVANPALLSGMEIATDGMSALLTIRGDAVWDDETPVTSADVAFSVNTLRDAPDNAVYKACVSNIASVDIVDASTVRLNLIQPYGAMAYMLMFPLIPANAAERTGNGLYTIASYMEAENAVLAASETTAQGRPYIDEIIVKITPDKESDMYAFDQGIIDAASPDIASWARYRGSETARASEYLSNYFEFVGFNFENEVMQDVQTRRLAEAVVSAEGFLDALYIDNAVRAQTPVSPASWLFERNTPPGVYDEAAVRTVLRGVPLRILANSENAERVKIAEALAAAYTAAGAVAEAVLLPFDAFSERLGAGEYDIFVGGYNLSVMPDFSFLLHSQAVGTTNLLRWQSAETDALLAAVAQAAGDMPLRRAMGDLQKHIAAELPLVGLVFRKTALVTSTRVYAEPAPVVNNALAGLAEWFINVQ